MYVTPEEVKEYSTFDVVKKRADSLIEYDILEAESYIESQLKLPLEEFEPLPLKIKLAIIKIAQFYSLINSDEAITKGVRSEKIGDYSYTLSDGTKISTPDVSDLLSEYMNHGDTNKAFMRLRSL